jgi:putative restriction endonuclease
MAAIFHIKSRECNNQCRELRFRFNDKYQHIVRDTLGDWIIYYQPMPRAGKRSIRPAGYFAAARVIEVHAAIDGPGYSEAGLEQYVEFPTSVPFSLRDPFFGKNLYFEKDMQESDGSVNASLAQRSVRAITDDNFKQIMVAGLRTVLTGEEPPVSPTSSWGFSEDPPAPSERTRILASRSLRDRAFRQMVGEAYGMECAMTGISMRAPDGTFEVECAHIMPVEAGGPDSASNGIALSRCLHWMFDKGLISIGADYRILKSRHYFQPQIDKLFNESGRINLPKNDSDRPHPEFLRYHRDNIFQR